MTKTTLNLGLEIGNRTSVLAVGPFGNSAKERTILQPSTYKPQPKRTGLTYNFNSGVDVTVTHDGLIYLAGDSCDGHDGALTVNSVDKYRETAALQILFKSLMGQILPKGKDRQYTAKIAFGMPIGWTNEDNIANVKLALSGKHVIETAAGHYGTVEIKPTNVMVYHEPIGAYAYLTAKSNGNMSTANIVDIGYNTTDLLSILNGVLVESQTDTIDYGMHDLYMLLQRYYQPLEGYRRPIIYWENFVKTYKHNSNNPSVGKVFNQFLSGLVNKITTVWSGLHNKPNLVAVGGGGEFIQPYFVKSGLDVVDVDQRQIVNALGLLYILLNS